MPGQRFASLKIKCTNTYFGGAIGIWLNGALQQFTPPKGGAAIGSYSAFQLAADIPARLAAIGPGATYTTTFLAGADASEGYVLITATTYNPTQDFQPSVITRGYEDVERLYGIKPVIIQYVQDSATCFGSTTGRIQLMPGNGFDTTGGPYTYLWDDGETSRVRDNMPAGSYTVTVTDPRTGAYAAATIVLGQNPLIVVQINRVANDLATVVTGGVAPYSYLWDDGSTMPDRPAVRGGVTYTVTVTDAAGCSKVASLRFELLRYWFSGNPIPLRLDAGDAYRLDPTTKPDLSFACEVYVEQDYLSNVFTKVGPTQHQPADKDGRTTFEVQELLEPYVQHHLPTPGQRIVTMATGLFRRFYLRHYEITTAGQSPAVTLDDNYLVRGGLGFVEAATGAWFGSYQDNRLPFFTWEPSYKRVLADQPEYLYFMVPALATTELRYCVRVSYANGTTETMVHTTRPGVRRYELYCLPAGFEQLGLSAKEGSSTVLSWEVYVLDQDDEPASERRTFALDRRAAPVRRYFHYANSLGGLNTICDRGRGRRELATATQAGAIASAAGYDALAGDVRIDRKTGLPVLKCFAGVRSAPQMVADEDFMLSEQVLLLDAGRYRAGIVKDRTFTAADADDTRLVLEFDFELPRERFFTPQLP